MPLSHTSKAFGVVDAKIAALTADPAGGAATYGTLTDVPGMKSVTIGGDITTNELRGDNQLLDANSVLSTVTLEFEYAKLSLDAIKILVGGTIVDAGTTPNQTANYTLLGTDTLGYFRFTAKTPTAGGDSVTGDVQFELYKCILTGFPEMGLAEEDYKTFTVSAIALPRLSDQKWIRTAFQETQSALV